MNSFIFRVQQRSKAKASGVVALWALVMAVSLFCIEVHSKNHAGFATAALTATILLGLYLGWHRRGGSVFMAPLVSWLVAWPPLWIGAMIRYGFVVGLFKGLFLITFGWLVIGGAEFAVLSVISMTVRMFRGRVAAGAEVVIFGPSDQLGD